MYSAASAVGVTGGGTALDISFYKPEVAKDSSVEVVT